ncbi:secretin and TonB N-terminal domain-containing protein [Mucisphaera calidilacus]|uniref:Type IV pilus biogenesis and competence protein PilQ n=1 Tax=Mucisphaera calidilacus TaxID=2527982 RepID=A0A518BTA3_9BACT|nr:secretin and TonB N-terminal domain-containing protein [Mucisphaera calidilacus]QDU70202.1 Type IV pilus biogenesis and competence protein PilQ precursor [Mucisphaera calidilacus]
MINEPSQPYRTLHRLGGVCLALALAAGASAQVDAPGDDGIIDLTSDNAAADLVPALSVTALGEIDLNVRDTEIDTVLNLLSEQARHNIVVSPNVRGTISASLYGVTFDEALDSLLTPNGFRYVRSDNFIHVYTAEEMREIEATTNKPVTRIIRLDFISSTDAQTFAEPLLSENGRLAISSEVPEGFEATISDGGANTYSHADTLIVHDRPEHVEKIVELLEELDRMPEQVMIEVTILQAKLSENNAFGVDFAILSDISISDATSPLAAVDELISGDLAADSAAAITSIAGNTTNGESSVKLGVIGGDAAVFVRALESITDTTVISTPKVAVLNRQRAVVDATEQLPYISTTESEISSTETIETIDVGTQLMVRPFISSDGYIRLELNPVLSEGSTELSPLGVILPNTSRQALQTNVMVRSGQTVVLGGLFKEDTTNTTNQVPYFGRIPILGNAFKGRDDSSERVEIIFLIKPTIVRDRVLAHAGEEARQGIERIRLGSRSGLLPFSRLRMLRSHLARAERYAREGDSERALWHTNIALSLEPISAEALNLKGSLIGRRLQERERGLLDGPVRRALQSAIETFNQPEPTPEPAATPPASSEPEDRALPRGSDRMVSGQARANRSLWLTPQEDRPGPVQQGEAPDQDNWVSAMIDEILGRADRQQAAVEVKP